MIKKILKISVVIAATLIILLNMKLILVLAFILAGTFAVIWVMDKEEAKSRDQQGKSRKSIQLQKRMSEKEIERFAIECNAYLEHQDEAREYEEWINRKSKKEEETHKIQFKARKYSDEYIESYAKSCNAYIEHEEEMKEYEEYFGIRKGERK